jgi:hypothetical protein
VKGGEGAEGKSDLPKNRQKCRKREREREREIERERWFDSIKKAENYF